MEEAITHTAEVASPMSATADGSKVFRLKWTSSGSYRFIDQGSVGEEVVFRNTPDFGDREIVTGSFPTGILPAEKTCYAADLTNRVLYVDQNRNLDLTDDSDGVFEGEAGESRYHAVRFQSLQVSCPVAEGAAARCARVYSLALYIPSREMLIEGIRPQVAVLSLWAGSVELGGTTLPVKVTENLDGVLDRGDTLGVMAGVAAMGSGESIDPASGLSAGRSIPLTSNLFFNGRDYRIESAWVKAAEGQPCDMTLTFTETHPPMGKFRIEGKGIVELALGNPVRAIRLKEPSGVIGIPAGRYAVETCVLRGDGVVLQMTGQPFRPVVEVRENETKALRVGAPVKSSVRATRMGRRLSLTYALRGGGGEFYESLERRDKPPTFTIYRGEKKIGSGTFEYG